MVLHRAGHGIYVQPGNIRSGKILPTESVSLRHQGLLLAKDDVTERSAAARGR